MMNRKYRDILRNCPYNLSRLVGKHSKLEDATGKELTAMFLPAKQSGRLSRFKICGHAVVLRALCWKNNWLHPSGHNAPRRPSTSAHPIQCRMCCPMSSTSIIRCASLCHLQTHRPRHFSALHENASSSTRLESRLIDTVSPA
jgi:hypothetical protein